MTKWPTHCPRCGKELPTKDGMDVFETRTARMVCESCQAKEIIQKRI